MPQCLTNQNTNSEKSVECNQADIAWSKSSEETERLDDHPNLTAQRTYELRKVGQNEKEPFTNNLFGNYDTVYLQRNQAREDFTQQRRVNT